MQLFPTGDRSVQRHRVTSLDTLANGPSWRGGGGAE